ncbi:hypothetical protein SNE40_009694 [Patella caerulea]|uniref:Reverse transcriptase domain-containing protein n=1 Tax=Patella caerulea TaxID=87958 RepID=A0AAN8PQL9_PATCE
MDIEGFRAAMRKNEQLQGITSQNSMSEQVEVYDKVLTDLLNDYAPLLTKTITIRPNTKWYNDEIRQSKRLRRKAEKKWRKSKLEIDRQIYNSTRTNTNNLMAAAKKQHFQQQLKDNKRNTKGIFKITNKLLQSTHSSNLPSGQTTQQLTQTFSDFFDNKVSSIRDQFDNDQPGLNQPDETYTGHMLNQFKPVSESEIKTLISSSTSKSCSLDPIPTWLLKTGLDDLLPVITSIVNTSLSTSEVPPSLKSALVNPLLKKPTLDPNILKNYRPVSNLSFISKLTEKVVAEQFCHHLEENCLGAKFQSAYRKCHSTESALVRVYNDVVSSIDKNRTVDLVLLDLSAAFDTIDQSMLLKRLSSRLGVNGAALDWFRSYLTDRKQEVIIDGIRSKQKCLRYGVPQGSVLGPLLFTSYTTPVADIMRRHDLDHHMYADDTQLYVEVDANNKNLAKLEACIEDLRNWMKSNFLKLNDDKTEAIFFSKTKLSLHNSVLVGDVHIETSDYVRNLGVLLDENLKMKRHVSTICKKANFHLYRIGRIRNLLDTDTTKLLINAFVTSTLDYSNSLLYGLPSYLIHQLQSIQNKAARIITRTNIRQHITPILADLHWLPINYRICFKINTLTYNCLNNPDSPAYLKDLIHLYIPQRSLRSSNQLQLKAHKTYTKFGERAFCFASPQEWNKLPLRVLSDFKY